jgi:hypothetical protein
VAVERFEEFQAALARIGTRQQGEQPVLVVKAPLLD